MTSLKDKTIIFSGVFEGYEREDLEKSAINNGAKIASGVSKNLNFLVAGEKMGPAKREKAIQLAIPIISLNDFLAMLEIKDTDTPDTPPADSKAVPAITKAKSKEKSINIGQKLLEYAASYPVNFWSAFSKHYISNTDKIKDYLPFITPSVGENTKIKWSAELIQLLHNNFKNDSFRDSFWFSLSKNDSINWHSLNLKELKDNDIWYFISNSIETLLTEDILLNIPDQKIKWFNIARSPHINWTEEIFDTFYQKFTFKNWDDMSQYFPFDVKKYREEINFACLGYNEKLNWTISLIEDNKNELNWYGLKTNVSIPWDVAMIKNFKKQLEDVDGLDCVYYSKTTEWRQELIDLLISLKTEIDWDSISEKKLSWDFINRYSDDLNWEGLSSNELIKWTLDSLKKYEDKIDWHKVSFNKSMPWSKEMIDMFAAKFDWEYISASMWEYMSWDEAFFDKYANRYNPKAWDEISSSRYIPWDINLVEKYKDKINWDGLSYYSRIAGSNKELVIKYIDNLSCTEIHQKLLPNDVVQKMIKSNYDNGKWENGTFFSKYYPWTDDWFALAEPSINWKSLGENAPYFPWSFNLIEKYKSKIKLDKVLKSFYRDEIGEKLFLAHADLLNEEIITAIINSNNANKAQPVVSDKKIEKVINISEFYQNKLKTKSQKTTVNFSTGNISLFESMNINDAGILNKIVPPGIYKIDIYYLPKNRLKDLEASPTVGIEAVVVNFNDNNIISWEEVTGSKIDLGNMIDFVIADHPSLDQIKDEISDVLEDCYTEGFETCRKELALVVYVGEVAIEHKFYWALDADGNPVKLVGAFRYPDYSSED